MRIALTGGIGSGKSEASAHFNQLQVPLLDTDVLARELVTPGQPALAEIVTLFGREILDQQGCLNRSKLRQLIFSDQNQRKALEQILHPRIRERSIEWSQANDAPYCILVIPLFIESALAYPVDRVLLIDVPTELQAQRVQQRDHLNKADIDAILAVQASRDERLAAADDIIVNDGTIEMLHARVDRLHERYLELAQQI